MSKSRKKHGGVTQVEYQGQTFAVTVLYSRRKTITLRIRPDRSLTIDAPTGVPMSYLHGVVQKKGAWILRKLVDLAEYAPAPSAPHCYITGERFPYLGREICLRVESGARTHIYLNGDVLRLTTPRPDDPISVEKILRGWYRAEAERIFGERLAVCQAHAAAIGIPAPQDLRLRWMTSRWGSCSGKGRVTLNIRLVFADLALIDYVILHELCHLKELNHSPRFYALMTRLRPDWKTHRLALKHIGMTW